MMPDRDTDDARRLAWRVELDSAMIAAVSVALFIAARWFFG